MIRFAAIIIKSNRIKTMGQIVKISKEHVNMFGVNVLVQFLLSQILSTLVESPNPVKMENI